ncbi:MAG: gluconate 2-dehydrogenase subunit 3 family protein [Cyclobacteriaceae bacterium]|nr:gluconate 2-dehydrogenase subunit 3 family protein [Cyclobacteriaceae bacterium]
MKRREALRKTAMITGSSALTPTLLSLLQSCQQQERLDWQPKFLSDLQAKLIYTLVDTLLPKTETPGALEVKVDMFIDAVFSDLYDEKGQASVIAGINDLDKRSQESYGDAFAELGEKDRTDLLGKLESESGKYNGSVWGTSVGKQEPVGFYRSVKSLALWGYFSSEEIGKNVLSYDPIPGSYLGCIPLSEVGNSWSL